MHFYAFLCVLDDEKANNRILLKIVFIFVCKFYKNKEHEYQYFLQQTGKIRKLKI